MLPRTDLASEQHARCRNLPKGVTHSTRDLGPLHLERILIQSQEGARALGKPVGDYITVTLPEDWTDPVGPAEALARQLASLLPQRGTVLVAGLGNRAVTPDALGPDTADRVLATRHLLHRMPDLFSGLRPVCVLSPGVLGTTGVETAEILGGVVDRVRPACLLAIDALCAANTDRLCRTVQLCDTGITPGEGTGTARCQLDRETLGIPVIALGMPTVTDVSTLVREQTGQQAREPGLLVTRSDIDLILARCTALLSRAVNMALQPDLSVRELEELLQA